jgi:hypothetical protein
LFEFGRSPGLRIVLYLPTRSGSGFEVETITYYVLMLKNISADSAQLTVAGTAPVLHRIPF